MTKQRKNTKNKKSKDKKKNSENKRDKDRIRDRDKIVRQWENNHLKYEWWWEAKRSKDQANERKIGDREFGKIKILKDDRG